MCEKTHSPSTADHSVLSSHVGYLLVSSPGAESVIEVRLSLDQHDAVECFNKVPKIVPSMTPSTVADLLLQMRRGAFASPATPQQNENRQPVEQSKNRITDCLSVNQLVNKRGNSRDTVYFRRQTANFGTGKVGSILQQKIDLCNATADSVVVYLSDPDLPFVLEHNEITIRPFSFVRVVARFVPVASKESECELLGYTGDGFHKLSILLLGVGETSDEI